MKVSFVGYQGFRSAELADWALSGPSAFCHFRQELPAEQIA
jgi:hypothetical protein